MTNTQYTPGPETSLPVVYELTYTMRIGNGPQKGEYDQFCGYTMSLAKAKAHVAERPDSHHYNAFYCDPAKLDILEFDAEDRRLITAIAKAEGNI